MKCILLAFSLLISAASFAQDNIDFILTDSYGYGNKEPLVFARISVSRRVYDLTKTNSKIELVCKYDKDKDLQLGLQGGQLYVSHKKYLNGKINRPCPSSSCYPRKFEDLSDHRQMAVSSPSLRGEQVTNYSIQSTNSWIKERDISARAGIDNWKYAELDNIQMLEIYSPSKHGKNLPSPVNGFTCVVADFAAKKYLEP